MDINRLPTTSIRSTLSAVLGGVGGRFASDAPVHRASLVIDENTAQRRPHPAAAAGCARAAARAPRPTRRRRGARPPALSARSFGAYSPDPKQRPSANRHPRQPSRPSRPRDPLDPRPLRAAASRRRRRRDRGDEPVVLSSALPRLTSKTPLQYQKQLRPKDAHVRLLSGGQDVAAVGFSIGYSSPSQFSRKYRHMFGVAFSQTAVAAS